MAKQRRYKAPSGYGAWVGDEFFEAGQLLPAGTEQYRVVTIEFVEGLARGWRTIQEIFTVGTPVSEIEDEFESMIAEMEATKSPPA